MGIAYLIRAECEKYKRWGGDAYHSQWDIHFGGLAGGSFANLTAAERAGQAGFVKAFPGFNSATDVGFKWTVTHKYSAGGAFNGLPMPEIQKILNYLSSGATSSCSMNCLDLKQQTSYQCLWTLTVNP